MASTSPGRRYSASADEVFAAAPRAAQELGYALVEVDHERRTLSFRPATRVGMGTDQRVSIEVLPDGPGSRVVILETTVRSALASRGRLLSNCDRPVPNRFLDALTRGLLAPPPGWLDDPSGRFAQRWWDGSSWTPGTRDSDHGVRFEDPPGALPSPWKMQAGTARLGPATPNVGVAPSVRTSSPPPLAWRASASARD